MFWRDEVDKDPVTGIDRCDVDPKPADCTANLGPMTLLVRSSSIDYGSFNLINAKTGTATALVPGPVPVPEPTSLLILGVGLYGFCVAWVCRRRDKPLAFATSLYLATYFAGSVCLVYSIGIPLTPLIIGTDISESGFMWMLMIITSVVGWAMLLRTLYGYMVLLKTSLEATWLSALGVFIRGTFVFFVMIYAILGWMTPLAFQLMDNYKMSQELFPSNQTMNPNGNGGPNSQ